MMRMLSAVFWLGRLSAISTAQKAIHLDVSYDLRDEQWGGGFIPGNPSYYVTLQLGTPPQAIKTVLSTSTSNFSVESTTALSCYNAKTGYNCTGIAFDLTASTTFSTLHNATSSTLPLAEDNIHLGSSTITNQSFSVNNALDHGFSPNHMGLQPGPQTDVPSNLTGIVPGVLDQLRTQKQINSRAYSLWLNREPTSTGSLVIGGVDTAAYSGLLVALPMLSSREMNLDFAIVCTSMTLTVGNRTQELVDAHSPLPMLLDTGAPGMGLPLNIYETLYEAFGPINNGVLVPCNYPGILNMQFGGSTGPVISIPASELLAVFNTSPGMPYTPNGEEICWPRLSHLSNYGYLGSVFFSSAYMVFDYDQRELSIAQGKRNVSGSNIVEIKSGPGGVPGVASTVTGPVPTSWQLAVASSTTSAINQPQAASSTTSAAKTTSSANVAVGIYPSALYKVLAVVLVILA